MTQPYLDLLRREVLRDPLDGLRTGPHAVDGDGVPVLDLGMRLADVGGQAPALGALVLAVRAVELLLRSEERVLFQDKQESSFDMSFPPLSALETRFKAK